VEHDIDMVRRTAEDVLLMDSGKIVAQGAPEELLNRPEILEAYLT
jgi:ABC-type branched-subunit amino acid transport system ATPase component